jgi:hypothetical protein
MKQNASFKKYFDKYKDLEQNKETNAKIKH